MAEPTRHPQGKVIRLKLDFEKGPRRMGKTKPIKDIVKRPDNSYVTYDYRFFSGNGPAGNSSY